MTSYPPAADIRRPKNGYPADKHRQDSRSRLLAIPDLRFEYSYLRSILPYIRLERSTSTSVPTSVQPQRNDNTSPTPVLTSEIIHVQWGKVIWITVREQVINPLLQGTLWALASYYLTPFSAQLGSKMGTFAHQRIASKEGSGVGWLRGWAKNLGLSRSEGDNSYPTQRTGV